MKQRRCFGQKPSIPYLKYVKVRATARVRVRVKVVRVRVRG